MSSIKKLPIFVNLDGEQVEVGTSVIDLATGETKIVLHETFNDILKWNESDQKIYSIGETPNAK